MGSLRIACVAIVLGSAALANAQPGPEYQPPPHAPPQPQPQPGGARVTFVSDSEKRWDVRIDDSAVCTTPCAIYVEPLHFVTMHSHDPHPQKLSVGQLPAGDVMVTAKPRADGLFATGVTFTSLGGMAAVTGITLTAVGCSSDRPTMCRAGLITGGIGLAVTFGSIRMIQQALPKVTVGPARAQPYVAGSQVGLAGSF